MFHHFYDQRHPRGQGAMSSADLESLIAHIGRDRILPARLWHEKALAGALKPGDLCLTFDDNLRCQFDVALPVLRRFKLTAFWFIYTSVFRGCLERLELYRQLRTLHYATVDAFYDQFFAAIDAGPHAGMVRDRLTGFEPADYLREFPFYTQRDRIFRFVRDEVLGQIRYFNTMDRMMHDAGVAPGDLARSLWMDENNLRELDREHHVIGLHSHTHPTRIGQLSAQDQRIEYAANQAILAEILGHKPTTMSHPCNSYSPATGPVLESLGIRLGFRANMAQAGDSLLEQPREDHANLLKRMAA